MAQSGWRVTGFIFSSRQQNSDSADSSRCHGSTNETAKKNQKTRLGSLLYGLDHKGFASQSFRGFLGLYIVCPGQKNRPNRLTRLNLEQKTSRCPSCLTVMLLPAHHPLVSILSIVSFLRHCMSSIILLKNYLSDCFNISAFINIVI